jgi:hypothetical protein
MPTWGRFGCEFQQRCMKGVNGLLEPRGVALTLA